MSKSPISSPCTVHYHPLPEFISGRSETFWDRDFSVQPATFTTPFCFKWQPWQRAQSTSRANVWGRHLLEALPSVVMIVGFLGNIMWKKTGIYHNQEIARIRKKNCENWVHPNIYIYILTIYSNLPWCSLINIPWCFLMFPYVPWFSDAFISLHDLHVSVVLAPLAQSLWSRGEMKKSIAASCSSSIRQCLPPISPCMIASKEQSVVCWKPVCRGTWNLTIMLYYTVYWLNTCQTDPNHCFWVQVLQLGNPKHSDKIISPVTHCWMARLDFGLKRHHSCFGASRPFTPEAASIIDQSYLQRPQGLWKIIIIKVNYVSLWSTIE